MKVIDLLQRIANGEEIPEYINYTHRVFGKDTMFVCKENIINKLDIGAIELNDEVEIIEEDKNIPTLQNLNLTIIDINKPGQIYGVTKQEIVADIQTLQNWINKIINKINKGE